MKDAYSSCSHRVIAYDDVVAQKMKDKKVLPKHKQFWGSPQVCVCVDLSSR